MPAPVVVESHREAVASPATELREPVVQITEPEALAVIEASIGTLSELAFGGQVAHNAALHNDASYRGIVDSIRGDVATLSAHDALAGVEVKGHAHRLFDVRWLASSAAHFELVAVTNRMDRHFYNPEGCGELRFVYRLAYRQRAQETELTSRLPMTLALELRADMPDRPGACAEAAARWLVPQGLHSGALAAHLTAPGGPLQRGQLRKTSITQLVTNVQTVRWPSAVRPQLGGHAEYVLRAFAWDAEQQRYRPRKLENTPDLARLRSAEQRKKLLAFVSAPDNLRALDSGNIRLPDEWLAESVVSVTPRGLARLANRPFRSLLAPTDLATLDLSGLSFARSPEALLRRLDDLTCSGCHQSRSIAGFHQLGDDALDASPSNALVTGSSPHVLMDLPRRAAYVRALAMGVAVDLTRPLAEHASAQDNGYGAHCGLGEPGFADWTCAPGLRCDPYEAALGEQTVGVCLPTRIGTGDPCEPARVVSQRDAHRDGVAPGASRACEQVCESTRVGFPGGMCAASCSRMPDNTACGGIAILTPFNACLAQQQPFSVCAREHVRPAGLRACSASEPCRDDYVCTRGQSERGVCLPPYFVFQLRVDGHPKPQD